MDTLTRTPGTLALAGRGLRAFTARHVLVAVVASVAVALLIGTVLAWFAVGCPVCNKIALLALGYSGAITWFAPMQPVLAALAVALCAIALVQRLKGMVVCEVSTR